MANLFLVNIDENYYKYLCQFDKNVSDISSINNKNRRPFLGILFNINDKEYFAPLSSPKAKHKFIKNSLDFLKISGGKYGAINFNNMIPLRKDLYKIVEVEINSNDSLNERKYKSLLLNQINFINNNSKKIIKNAKKLYNLYINNKLNIGIIKRCCNFILLEEKCNEYSNLKIAKAAKKIIKDDIDERAYLAIKEYQSNHSNNNILEDNTKDMTNKNDGR